MLCRLRRRLTIIFTVLTGVVLGATLSITYLMAQQQYSSSMDMLHQNTVTSIVIKLQTERSIKDLWLATLETDSRSIIHIEDKGVALHFQGSWKTATDRSILIGLAKAEAEKQGVSLTGTPHSSLYAQQLDFALKGQSGEPYKVTVVRIPIQYGWYNLVLLEDISARSQHLVNLLLLYIGLGVIGILALYTVNWFIAGLAIRPTAEAIREQSDFVAAASHELRNPLAVINANIFAARQQPEEATRFLEIAQRETERLARLVNDLFLLAGSDAKTWSLSPKPVETDTLCIEVYEQMRLLASQKGHVLQLCLPEEVLPAINADKERLVQLLVILLSNAMDYAPAGTPILLKAELLHRNVQLSVVDHGPGIPDEAKRKVFERFYRMEKSRTDKAHFGLGLSVAKELAALHGGTLTLTDTPGGGATFIVTLPL
ncbi:sensor histidine kinase [Acetanaerobacterium elongatum]|uniref:histidine kinase n=1 Tax=Acetanaerobacterium elongatum TaxID=258515 RepID=A0A1G9WBN9_9FIRM|nr:HAMP domain-containing sensor histidine kinase [Acetanaerobacterium elongatum]SDM81737.1 His Kinase A (phospho-acceptor) domain-containing protein [Acetanaerobacterium elongatum]